MMTLQAGDRDGLLVVCFLLHEIPGEQATGSGRAHHAHGMRLNRSAATAIVGSAKTAGRLAGSA
jgi:hypothetical protein